jgi:hypothetical protein
MRYLALLLACATSVAMGQTVKSAKAEAQEQTLNDSFPKSSTAALGRQHSATNGCFREAKLQRQLSGDELEETSVA